MARLDVYRLRGSKERLVVDVQSDWLSHLSTRTVVPLMADGEIGDPITDLNPKFDLGADTFVLFPQLIASVPKSDLKQRITSLSPSHDVILRALDVLFTGF
jgi:toxin CcdB